MDKERQTYTGLIVVFLAMTMGLLVAIIVVSLQRKSEEAEMEKKYESGEVMMEEAKMTMYEDNDKTRSVEAIEQAVGADEKLKTIDSAVTVMNVAGYYDDMELLDKYTAILNERLEAAGIDISGETDG